ncbi:hypothetical protein ACFL6O_04430 [candidate division KSB1 bacterium]
MLKTYKVDLERIEKELFKLKQFGYNSEDKGIYRPGLTGADMEARKWLVRLFEENGLKTKMDGAANVIGRFGDPAKPAIAVGSHTDTVPAPLSRSQTRIRILGCITPVSIWTD